jgi:hypothetical protein
MLVIFIRIRLQSLDCDSGLFWSYFGFSLVFGFGLWVGSIRVDIHRWILLHLDLTYICTYFVFLDTQ